MLNTDNIDSTTRCEVCNNYSIQVNEAPNINEDASLLVDGGTGLSGTQRSRLYDGIFLMILSTISLLGLCAGGYLLLIQGEEWSTPSTNLIPRESWRALAPSTAMPQLRLPVTSVLFLQTNSTCTTMSQCSSFLNLEQRQHMSQQQPDIVYNFIVGPNGVYEGRGWTYQSNSTYTRRNNSITIAFLGESAELLHSAKLFLDHAVRERNLKSCYEILVWGENRFLIANVWSFRPDC